MAETEMRMKDGDRDALLAAACTVRRFEASRILGISQQGNIHEIPDLERFQALFTFTADDLIDYIKRRPDLVQKLLNASLDNRVSGAAYFRQTENDHYEVAPRVGYPITTFRDPTKAAAAYVRACWRLR